MQVPERTIGKVRVVAVVVLVLLLVPVVASALTYDDPVEATNSGEVDRTTAQNVTFVAAQGAEFSDTDARLVALQTDSQSVLWEYSKYQRYFDVDPLGDNRVLFAAAQGVSGRNMLAVEMNWRTGEVYRTFPIPKDTHDLDYLGDDKYAIAQKERRAYVYDFDTNETIWEYDFEDEYPSQSIHLNDIDAIDNGSAFLVSPRNIDQVMLINRSDKKAEWILGEEGNYDILNHQHNPVLLDDDPVTVLVADSENDRVVEYRRTNSGWERTWMVDGLSWPRDADRLPNGNTMIADSNGQQVLEVSPTGEVVWQFDIAKGPYDIERLQYGDEPSGPTMEEYNGSVARETTLGGNNGVIDNEIDNVYHLTQWILPSWVTRSAFLSLLFGSVVVLAWVNVESVRVLPRERIRERGRLLGGQLGRMRPLLATMEMIMGVLLLWSTTRSSDLTTVYAGLGTLLAVDGGLLLARKFLFPRLEAVSRALPAILSVGASTGPIALGIWSVNLGRRNFLTGLFVGLGVLLLVRGGQHMVRGVWSASNVTDRPVMYYVADVLGLVTVLAGGTLAYLATKPTNDVILLPLVGMTIVVYGLQIADFDRIWRRGSRARAFFLLPKIVFVVAAIAVSIVALGSVLELSLRTGVVVGLILLLCQAILEDASL